MRAVARSALGGARSRVGPAALLLAVAAGGCVARVTESRSPRWAAEAGGSYRPATAPPPAVPAGPPAGPAAPPAGARPAAPGAPLRVEADRIRLVVPDRLGGAVVRSGTGPWDVIVEGLWVRSRGGPAEVDVAGDDLSIVAEGDVRVTPAPAAGGNPREEGPFALYVFRNGRDLRR